jgi:Universal stress protein family
MQADPREPVVPRAAASLSVGNPVLLVVAGSVVSHAAIARAAQLAAGTPVTVVGVGRNDLSRTELGCTSRPAANPCWGVPSPPSSPARGSEPETHRTDEEPEQVRRAVALAMSALENTGVVGKVRIVTGSPARAVARVARSSGARVVILGQPGTALRHRPADGFVTELRRRMHGSGVVVLAETDLRGGWVSG